MSRAIPLRQAMCATCPFRPHSPTAYIAATIAETLTETSRICHSTGRNNAFHRRTGKPPALCRGARDLQLQYFAATGFLSEPTDAAWDAKARQSGFEPNQCRP